LYGQEAAAIPISVWQDRARKRSACLYPTFTLPSPGKKGQGEGHQIVVDTSEHYAIRQDSIPRKGLSAFPLLIEVMPLRAADEEGPKLDVLQMGNMPMVPTPDGLLSYAPYTFNLRRRSPFLSPTHLARCIFFAPCDFLARPQLLTRI
jgi:hypothetical protein